MQIQPEEENKMHIYKGGIINNFLERSKWQYKIPVYQRNYEWSFEQCEKLFEDIVRAAQRAQEHFCGVMVFQSLGLVMGMGNDIIIDGQQRLTTIYILLKALLDKAQEENDRIEIQKLLFNTDPYMQMQGDKSSKLKLKAAKEDNKQLLALICDEPSLDENCEICRNYRHFCSLIDAAQTNGITVDDIFRGIRLLTVAVVELSSDDNAQEIFERINSTGIPLSLADKIRNYVLMTNADQDRLYEAYWLPTEKLFSKEQLSNFFLDYLNMKLDGFTRESTAYADFKRMYEQGDYTNEKILSEIQHYARQYSIFCDGDVRLGERVNHALEGLRRLKQTTVYLFLFHVFDDFQVIEMLDNGTVNGDKKIRELEKTLNLLLNYSVRRLICEIASNSLRGLYKTLHSRVFLRSEYKEHYYDAIISFLLQLTSKDAMPSDEEFKTALKERNLYRKNALCKYLLSSIENQGSKEPVQLENVSIEHILPQNKNLSTAWQKMLGEDWEAVRDKYLHTLGNLTLTGYNSELGDMDFAEKQKKLSEKITHITVLYEDVKGKTEWNAETIESRAEHLSQKLLFQFSIEKPATEIRFIDSRYRMYTVANARDATRKVINYYELLGERVKVNYFVEMVRSVSKKLYERDPRIIEGMARKNEPFPTWLNPAFSYDMAQIKEAVKLRDDLDIYMSGKGYSAYDCICFIRALLRKYGLDIEQDFQYSARSWEKTTNN